MFDYVSRNLVKLSSNPRTAPTTDVAGADAGNGTASVVSTTGSDSAAGVGVALWLVNPWLVPAVTAENKSSSSSSS